MTERGDDLYFQPCLSPVWDTALAAHALLEAGPREEPRLTQALDWLAERQVLDHVGDWAVRRPGLRPGGWAFQYANPDYPDVDDSAVVALAMHRADPVRYAGNVARACEWIEGMQSRSGGWGAFDPENEHTYLNSIPFADHGALLDPPTVDVTARCIGCLAQVDAAGLCAKPSAAASTSSAASRRADGSWYGRWGANYVYGTWSALVALKGAGEDMSAPYVRRAVAWLVRHQHTPMAAGARGWKATRPWVAASSAPRRRSQTAWALLGLMSAGELETEPVRRGIAWLESAPREGARWQEEHFTGTGFPRVFYPEISRLPGVLPALGAGPPPPPHGLERPRGAVGHLTRRFGGGSRPPIPPPPKRRGPHAARERHRPGRGWRCGLPPGSGSGLRDVGRGAGAGAVGRRSACRLRRLGRAPGTGRGRGPASCRSWRPPPPLLGHRRRPGPGPADRHADRPRPRDRSCRTHARPRRSSPGLVRFRSLPAREGRDRATGLAAGCDRLPPPSWGGMRRKGRRRRPGRLPPFGSLLRWCLPDRTSFCSIWAASRRFAFAQVPSPSTWRRTGSPPSLPGAGLPCAAVRADLGPGRPGASGAGGGARSARMGRPRIGARARRPRAPALATLPR